MLQKHLVSPLCKNYSSVFDLGASGDTLLALQTSIVELHVTEEPHSNLQAGLTAELTLVGSS